VIFLTYPQVSVIKCTLKSDVIRSGSCEVGPAPIGDQLLIERYEPKKPRPEETDTVLAAPSKPDDLSSMVSRGAVVPIAPQRATGEKPRPTVAGSIN
jgi:hypothetical protein